MVVLYKCDEFADSYDQNLSGYPLPSRSHPQNREMLVSGSLLIMHLVKAGCFEVISDPSSLPTPSNEVDDNWFENVNMPNHSGIHLLQVYDVG